MMIQIRGTLPGYLTGLLASCFLIACGQETSETSLNSAKAKIRGSTPIIVVGQWKQVTDPQGDVPSHVSKFFNLEVGRITFHLDCEQNGIYSSSHVSYNVNFEKNHLVLDSELDLKDNRIPDCEWPAVDRMEIRHLDDQNFLELLQCDGTFLGVFSRD